MLEIKTNQVDVLILGAGLAGLRAAWAARRESPDISICVVSQQQGASGSSFSNINDMLGMQVCLTESEKEIFVREALAIAPPGEIAPSLAGILAEDSLARFRDLETAGLNFRKTDGGDFLRSTACFSPHDRAFIFSGLHQAFSILRKICDSPQTQFLEGWSVQDLVSEDSAGERRVHGAVMREASSGKRMAVSAKAVVVALGGPASLFHRNVSGPGTHGVSHALLKRAGATIVNPSFLQFLWHEVDTARFWSIQSCLTKEARIRTLHGDVLPVPESLFPFSIDRAGHCPVGYGMADAAVDHFFIENLNLDGSITVYTPSTGWREIALMAHAGNGGAKIDADARTGALGLYACGESAGGMHGANRIGGAMVTATQVFGARAGKAAAIYAAYADPMNISKLRRLSENILLVQVENDAERRDVIPWIRRGMQEFAVFGGRPGLDDFLGKVRERLDQIRDWRTRLAMESALIVGAGNPLQMKGFQL